MPDNAQYSALTPLSGNEETRVYQPDQAWSDEWACKIAVQDFNRAEQYRTQNADWRWRNADELYQAWVQQKYWDGTRVPRASIGVYVAFEQVESMLPKILGAIFGDMPWFQSDPILGTTPEQARQWRGVLLTQMDEARVREIFRRCIKSGMIYGNGIMKLGWNLREFNKLEWIPRMRPKVETIMDPFAGPRQQFAGFERILDKQKIKTIINEPTLEYVSLKDFYIDPNCGSPQVQDGRYCATRKLVTVEDLDGMRDLAEFKIPDKMKLLEWAIQKPSTQGDATKGASELFRMGQWAPQIDQTSDPGGQRIEVIEYWTKDRLVWVANREKAILNTPNSYGFLPFYDAFYADVLDRFYAMGVCDVVEGEQRLQASILNARLDELALSIHRPVKKKRGLSTPQYMLRVRPGQVIEMDDTEKDYRLMETENITAQAYVEVNASEMRVQKTTGQADLYSTGVPSSGGNSASRTATGIGAQVQASGSRIQYLVQNLEDTFIEPMLNDLVTLNQLFPPIGTSEADAIALSKVKVTMRASSKMQARMGLLQTFPLLMQTLTSAAQDMAMNGETINWEAVTQAVNDMTGWTNHLSLVRKLTPEEQQQRNQPPAQEMVRMQMQKERIAGQQQGQREKLAAQQGMERERMAGEAEQDEAYVLADLAKALIAAMNKPEKADTP